MRGDNLGKLHCYDENRSEGTRFCDHPTENYLLGSLSEEVSNIMEGVEEGLEAIEHQLGPECSRLEKIADETLEPIFWKEFEPRLATRLV